MWGRDDMGKRRDAQMHTKMRGNEDDTLGRGGRSSQDVPLDATIHIEKQQRRYGGVISGVQETVMDTITVRT
jgi:hypothetical protein